MINEKMSIKLYPMSYKKVKEPGLWYDLTKIRWDHNNKIVTVSFLMGINIFKLILQILTEQTLIPSLWVSSYDDDDDDLDYVNYISKARIKYIQIKNHGWGKRKVFLPECTIQFQYDKIEELDIFDLEVDKEYRNFLNEQGEFEFFINNNDYYLNANDFDFYISFDQNLFPIGFSCSSNFDDNLMRESAIKYLENQKNIDIVFQLSKKQEICSLTIKNCEVDYVFKDKETGNLLGVLNNLVLYGSSNQNTDLIFNIGEKASLINMPLEEYILEEPPADFVMKDQFGSVVIEL